MSTTFLTSSIFTQKSNFMLSWGAEALTTWNTVWMESNKRLRFKCWIYNSTESVYDDRRLQMSDTFIPVYCDAHYDGVTQLTCFRASYADIVNPVYKALIGRQFFQLGKQLAHEHNVRPVCLWCTPPTHTPPEQCPNPYRPSEQLSALNIFL